MADARSVHTGLWPPLRTGWSPFDAACSSCPLPLLFHPNPIPPPRILTPLTRLGTLSSICKMEDEGRGEEALLNTSEYLTISLRIKFSSSKTQNWDWPTYQDSAKRTDGFWFSVGQSRSQFAPAGHAKFPEARPRGFCAIDDSKIATRGCLGRSENSSAPDRAGCFPDGHAENHPAQPRAWRWDNKNPNNKCHRDAAGRI